MGVVKTTVEIADGLLLEAKRVAERRGTTLRALIEAGLRSELSRAEHGVFRLRDASVGGRGINPDWQVRSWHELRDAIYEGRGG